MINLMTWMKKNDEEKIIKRKIYSESTTFGGGKGVNNERGDKDAALVEES